VKTSAYTANLCSGAMLAESWGRSMKITFLEGTHKRKESFLASPDFSENAQLPPIVPSS
jgi:hypothetical protein